MADRNQTFLVIGEILWDLFPSYKRLGGAPFNFAFHVHHFGRAVHLVSGVGNDENGKKIVAFLQKYHLDISMIQVVPGYPTGQVLVQLDEQGKPRFNILTETAYDQIEYQPVLTEGLAQTDLVYFGSLIQRTRKGHETLHRILKQRPAHTRCLYDVNLRPGCYNKAVVNESLKLSDVVKLNNEELDTLMEMFAFSHSQQSFIDYLLNHYRLDMLCLTCGAEGSHLYTADRHSFAKAAEIDRIADTVGAGDAFAAVLAIGYLEGWQPGRILETASTFSSHICQIEGAVPLEKTNDFYNLFKAGNPYKESP
jgi:fructokinase